MLRSKAIKTVRFLRLPEALPAQKQFRRSIFAGSDAPHAAAVVGLAQPDSCLLMDLVCVSK